MIFRALSSLTFAIVLGLPVAAQEAPFGLAWGPVDKIAKPNIAEREGNITTLFYDRSSGIAAGADTDRVIVEVCRAEGIQQVIWISRQLSADELEQKYQAAHRQGNARYGEPRTLQDLFGETWKDGRVFLGVSKGLSGQQRLIMFMRGEKFNACSSEHDGVTGHPAAEHVRNLLQRAY